MKNLVVGSEIKFKIKSWSEHIVELDPKTTSFLLKDKIISGIFSRFFLDYRDDEIVKMIVIDDIAYDFDDILLIDCKVP